MAVTEAARHDLYTYLLQTMGDERAATLMALLPHFNWADVATKQDLEHLRTSLRNELTGYFERALRMHALATSTFTAVVMGIAVTLAR